MPTNHYPVIPTPVGALAPEHTWAGMLRHLGRLRQVSRLAGRLAGTPEFTQVPKLV